MPLKVASYTEILRALRPGGRLPLHEILAGPAFPIHLPVQRARRPELSHPRPPKRCALLEETGSKELAWIDESDTALRWHKERPGAIPEKSSPLGLHLVLGDYLGALLRNQVRNLEKRRISIAQAVLERHQPSSYREWFPTRPGSEVWRSYKLPSGAR